MKIDIKKSEVNIIKEALSDCAALIYNDKWLGLEDHMIDPELEIKYFKLKKSYKIFKLKKLAMVEHRIVSAQVKEGWLKRISGNLRCWWRWTTTDENWEKTRFAKKNIRRR